ncbi:MAG: GDP-mannose 4,6-dehydratase [bacterium]|nr:GDP-mannose 4,6-dehydratase [bacterium]
MNILITGGAGFIGSHLCERLLADWHYIYCIDNLSTGSRSNISSLEKNEHFIFINADVSSELPVDALPKQIDRIYHLASPASPNHHSPISYHALPMETMMVNTVGTHNMLKLAQKYNARFLFTSTSEIYGEPLEHPQKESYRGNVSTTGPRSVYDEAKRFGETLTAYYQREKKVDTRIVRIFNTYGPHMSDNDMRMSVLFMQQALKNEPITIFGDGTQTRSLCFVEDLVDGLVKFMEHDDLAGEIINLGSTDEKTVLEYAQLIKSIAKSESEITVTEKLPVDDPKQRKPDITKAKELLGWEPKTSIEDGIKKTIDHIRTNS